MVGNKSDHVTQAPASRLSNVTGQSYDTSNKKAPVQHPQQCAFATSIYAPSIPYSKGLINLHERRFAYPVAFKGVISRFCRPYSTCYRQNSFNTHKISDMVRERTPARTGLKPQLGDSWVVESDDGDADSEYTPPQAISSARPPSRATRRQPDVSNTPRQKISRPNARASAEPEFIMPSPSTAGGNISSSWLGEETPKGNRRANQAGNQMRRLERYHGPHEPNPSSSSDSGVMKAFDSFMEFLTPIFLYIVSVLGQVFHMLKLPIAFIIAVWCILGFSVFLRNFLFTSIYSALSPICRIPGSSFLNLPMCKSPVAIEYHGDDPPPVQFGQLVTVQNRFDEILQESAGGVSLPLDMKRGETSIRDLRQIVRFSQLHSKNELLLEFDGFIETARIASYDLQKFNSHVGRGVDNILATARWTKRMLDGIAERDATKGAMVSFFNDKLLAPFQPLKFTEDLLLDQYIQYTRVVEDEISRLVIEAQALLLVLQNLEDRLDVVHGIVVRDDTHAQGGKTEVLSQLWTMLGGNRNKLGKFDSQLRLLGQVNTYRQNAIAHVSGTLIKLQSMGAELEELRERVGGTELLGGRGSIPLSLHIENIEMGVERLEKGRKGAKELENEELRKSLEGGKARDRMIEGP